MTSEAMRRLVVKNSRKLHIILLKQLKDSFDGEFVNAWAIVNEQLVQNVCRVSVRGNENGGIVLALEGGFGIPGTDYVLAENALVLMEDGPRISFSCENGFVTMIAE